MDEKRKIIVGAAAVLLSLVLTGCLNVKIVRNVDDPGRYFDRTLRQIQEIQAEDPHRKGEPHALHIMIYERSSHELVQVETPMWIVKSGLDIGKHASRHGDDRGLGNKYDFDWKVISDLERFGRGLLVQVEDNDNQILVWLD